MSGQDTAPRSKTWADATTDMEQGAWVGTAQGALHKISSWANRGNLRQFYTEMSAKFTKDANHEVVLEGDTLTFFALRKEGGFLGFGGHRSREPVLRLVQVSGRAVVGNEYVDEEFAVELANSLTQHQQQTDPGSQVRLERLCCMRDCQSAGVSEQLDLPRGLSARPSH